MIASSIIPSPPNAASISASSPVTAAASADTTGGDDARSDKRAARPAAAPADDNGDSQRRAAIVALNALGRITDSLMKLGTSKSDNDTVTDSAADTAKQADDRAEKLRADIQQQSERVRKAAETMYQHD